MAAGPEEQAVAPAVPVPRAVPSRVEHNPVERNPVERLPITAPIRRALRSQDGTKAATIPGPPTLAQTPTEIPVQVPRAPVRPAEAAHRRNRATPPSKAAANLLPDRAGILLHAWRGVFRDSS